MKDISRNEFMAIWWAFFWRSIVFGLVIGFILGGISGLLISFLGHPEYANQIGVLMGFIASLAATIAALWFTLRKKYKLFDLAVIRKNKPPF